MTIILTAAIWGVPVDKIQAAGHGGFATPQGEDPKTVWDGVYTAEESERGQVAFEMNCASCHGAEDGRQPGAGVPV